MLICVFVRKWIIKFTRFYNFIISMALKKIDAQKKTRKQQQKRNFYKVQALPPNIICPRLRNTKIYIKNILKVRAWPSLILSELLTKTTQRKKTCNFWTWTQTNRCLTQKLLCSRNTYKQTKQQWCGSVEKSSAAQLFQRAQNTVPFSQNSNQ